MIDAIGKEQVKFMRELVKDIVCVAPLDLIKSFELCSPVAKEAYGFAEGDVYSVRNNVFYLLDKDLPKQLDRALRLYLGDYIYYQNMPYWSDDLELDSIKMWASIVGAYLKIDRELLYDFLLDVDDNTVREQILSDFHFCYSQKEIDRFAAVIRGEVREKETFEL